MTFSVTSATRRPLVLVHGLWDTPRLFRRLERQLETHAFPLLVPHLPHRLGAVPLCNLAEQLDGHIRRQFGDEQTIDLLGFSMGVSSPEFGFNSSEACIAPIASSVSAVRSAARSQRSGSPWLFAGLADMKRSSPLLRSLNDDVAPLRQIDCLVTSAVGT